MAVHVVTTTRRYKGRVYKTHLLRRSYREGGKVKNETLGNLSHLPEEVIALIRRALRGETLIPAGAAFQILRSRPHGHVAAVLGTIRKLGLERILASRPSVERDRCVALIAARVLSPGSKLATARTLRAETATSTLGQMLHLDPLEAGDLYAAMDWLIERQPKIEQALAKRHLSNGTLVLYDVSSSYFKGGTVAWPASAIRATARKAPCRSSTGCCATPRAVRWRCRSMRATPPIPARWPIRSRRSVSDLDSIVSCSLGTGDC